MTNREKLIEVESETGDEIFHVDPDKIRDHEMT
jgi:hypothetical protein